MKTYPLKNSDIIRLFEYTSYEINGLSALVDKVCDKSWRIFDDQGKPEVLVFRPDGVLLITRYGYGVRTGKWAYMHSHNLIFMSEEHFQIYMASPVIADNNLLVLRLEEHAEVIYLIDDNITDEVSLNSLSDIENYLFTRLHEIERNLKK